MREIKFRAWDGSVMCEIYTLPLVNPNDLVTVISPNGNLSVMQKPIIMQYTGLKDKNGKEIYEGDLIMCTRYIFNGTDVFAEIAKRIQVINYFLGSFCCRLGHLLDVIGQYEIELVGNIYENPELLGGNNEQD